MSADRAAALVRRWVRRYTRQLPEAAARRRRAEVDADLHDHIAHERAQGTADRRIAVAIAGRLLRGLAADVAWRRQIRPKEHRPMRTPAIRVTVVTAAILLLPLIGGLVSDGVDWSVADFVLLAVLLAGTGALLEVLVRRPDRLVVRVAAVVAAVAAVVAGEADDAPGLVGFGLLLFTATVALHLRLRPR